MDKLTAFLGFLTALSLATERITETIKGLPVLSGWLAVEQKAASAEEFRKAALHILAIGIGTTLVALTLDQLSTAAGTKFSGPWVPLLFGAMASGGSGMWNSALDIVREVNKQKQLVTEKLKSPTT